VVTNFWVLYFFFQGLILLSCFFAHRAGFFWQDDARRQVPEGTPVGSISTHGGVWGDALYLSAVFAWIVSCHANEWTKSEISFGVSVGGLLTALLLRVWSKSGVEEAMVRCGKTTAAGWIHGLYTWIGLAILFTILAAGRGFGKMEAAIICAFLIFHTIPGSLQPSWITNDAKISKQNWKQFWISFGLLCLLWFRITR
jgi:hypothetical protein